MQAGGRFAMIEENGPLYITMWAMLLAASGLLGIGTAYAQSREAASPVGSTPDWHLILDGERADWPGEPPTAPLDSVRHVGQVLLDRLQEDGYYYAQVDSVVLDTTSTTPAVRLYAERGPRVVVGHLRIEGAEAVASTELRRLMDTEEGEPLDPQRLEADVAALLDRYEADGRPLAQIRMTETRLDTASPPRLRLTLRVDEGPSLWLRRIEVPDEARTSPGLLARLANLRIGDPLTNYDPTTIRESLLESPFFESVGRPELTVTEDGGATLRLPVDESPPGSFDLVVGYLPPGPSRSGGQLVGNGQLSLKHLFGGGRRFDLKLDRRPGQTSIFDLSMSDPYIFGLPFRVTGTFRGEQRDSTYGERQVGLDAGYELGGDLELSGSLSREVTEPGRAGARLRSGRQRIPRSHTLFYGLGLRYESVERRSNPRRGLRVSAEVEQGQKERTVRRVTPEQDTVRNRQSLQQERLRGLVRGYLPLADRQVVMVGGDGSMLRSREYDRSDLFRFGGAESLRGYDEDRFLGTVTARGLVEYRLLVDRQSYVYTFLDVGYVARPGLGGTSPTEDWHPGYGLGLQLQTAIGRITTTYALNPEVSTPVDGRIHFGVSVDL